MQFTGLRQRCRTWEATHAPWSAQAIRDTAFVGAGVPLGVVALAVIAVPWLVFVPVALWAVVLAVVAPLALLMVVAPVLTIAQRRRFRLLAGIDLPAMAVAPSVGRPDRAAWLHRRSTWRQFVYHLVVGPAAAAAGVVACGVWFAAFALTTVFAWAWLLPSSSPVRGGVGWTVHDLLLTGTGILIVLIAPWGAAAVTAVDVGVGARLLGLSRVRELERRMAALDESRAGLVDAADDERRRIERDLHDGAQARLVSLAVNLGLARARFVDVPEDVIQVIDEAQDDALRAIAELKHLARGLHPAVLDDRGLDAALSGLAARMPFPVSLHVEMHERALPTVEAVAYFVVSEGLTNIATHAAASRAEVSVVEQTGVLRVVVTDDGVGGAEPSRGSGLSGLAKRVQSVDGTFTLRSPEGGPTSIMAVLPCES